MAECERNAAGAGDFEAADDVRLPHGHCVAPVVTGVARHNIEGIRFHIYLLYVRSLGESHRRPAADGETSNDVTLCGDVYVWRDTLGGLVIIHDTLIEDFVGVH